MKAKIYIILFLTFAALSLFIFGIFKNGPELADVAQPKQDWDGTTAVNTSETVSATHPSKPTSPTTQSTTLPTSPVPKVSVIGGFVEKSTDTKVRPLLSLQEIREFLPERGGFVFPNPYNTQAARITNSSDCDNTDCVYYAGYSYWRNMNNSVGQDNILIFVGMKHEYGGPTLYSYNKVTSDVKKLGPLFDKSSPYSYATAEGWYWSAKDPYKIYVSTADSQLLRYDVNTKQFQTVFDISAHKNIFGENSYIWQTHSSNDDNVHSAAVREKSSYAYLGCMTYDESTKEFQFFKTKGILFDECQIDKSGKWLLIKEKLGSDSEDVDNRIINLETKTESAFMDKDGAGGHSDNGFGYYLAVDNWNQYPNAIRLWKFGTTPLGPGTVVYRDPSWQSNSVQHISFANAKAGVAIEDQYACGSGANPKNGPRANEIVCFKLDGSLRTLVVAPVMTNIVASGDDNVYGKLPKGNLDTTGEYFFWTSNMDTSRLDAFIVKIPVEKL